MSNKRVSVSRLKTQGEKLDYLKKVGKICLQMSEKMIFGL